MPFSDRPFPSTNTLRCRKFKKRAYIYSEFNQSTLLTSPISGWSSSWPKGGGEPRVRERGGGRIPAIYCGNDPATKHLNHTKPFNVKPAKWPRGMSKTQTDTQKRTRNPRERAAQSNRVPWIRIESEGNSRRRGVGAWQIL